MLRNLSIILILFQVSCVNKSLDYWIEPENQDGSLDGFYATAEYCELLIKNCPEHGKLIQIIKEKENLLSEWTKNEVVTDETQLKEILLDRLETIYNEMILYCGGYCSNAQELPILPYREKDVQAFWTESRILNLREIFSITFLRLQKVNPNISMTDLDSVIQITSGLKDCNTIEAMIIMNTLELKLLKTKK